MICTIGNIIRIVYFSDTRIFYATTFIQPLRIHQASNCDVNIVRANAIQYFDRIAAFKLKLGKRGLIEQGDILAYCSMLGGRIVKPVLTAVTVFVLSLNTWRRIPIGTLPTECLPVARSGCNQSVVNRGLASAACSFTPIVTTTS